MAAWGYIVIASQYSGNAGSEGKEDLGGQKTKMFSICIHSFRKNSTMRTLDRIGMYGASRGGMMTYLA